MREHLLKKGIPCVVSDLDHFDIFLPAELIIITEKYLLNDVKYMADMYGKHNIVVCDEYKPLIREAETKIYEYFNRFRDIRKSRVTTINERIIFCGKELRLTPTEKRIFKMFLYSDKIYTAEAVAAFCLENTHADPATAISHISKINRKAKRLTGLELINNKRFEGYSLNII